jgi:hypothetical protein
MKRRKWFAISLTIVGALLSKSASATVVEELSTTQLTKEANSVALGQVASSYSSWDPEKRMVFTYVKFRVDQTLKGQPSTEVMIRQAGGRIGGIGMVVHGMASFRNGERALVFLKQDADGVPSLVGMAQGKFRVYRSAVTGEEMALFRAPQNLEFYARGSQGRALHVVQSPEERRVPLRDLIGEIQAVVRSENP